MRYLQYAPSTVKDAKQRCHQLCRFSRTRVCLLLFFGGVEGVDSTKIAKLAFLRESSRIILTLETSCSSTRVCIIYAYTAISWIAFLIWDVSSIYWNGWRVQEKETVDSIDWKNKKNLIQNTATLAITSDVTTASRAEMLFCWVVQCLCVASRDPFFYAVLIFVRAQQTQNTVKVFEGVQSYITLNLQLRNIPT